MCNGYFDLSLILHPYSSLKSLKDEMLNELDRLNKCKRFDNEKPKRSPVVNPHVPLFDNNPKLIGDK